LHLETAKGIADSLESKGLLVDIKKSKITLYPNLIPSGFLHFYDNEEDFRISEIISKIKKESSVLREHPHPVVFEAPSGLSTINFSKANKDQWFFTIYNINKNIARTVYGVDVEMFINSYPGQIADTEDPIKFDAPFVGIGMDWRSNRFDSKFWGIEYYFDDIYSIKVSNSRAMEEIWRYMLKLAHR